jgi:DNA adenine methylase
VSEFVEQVPALPFLRWAGGKRQLVGKLLELVPQRTELYYEPFLGAGSLFFSLSSNMKKYVGDFNAELISVYRELRDSPEQVISELTKMENTKDQFMTIRSWDRDPGFQSVTSALRAARFIYLNKYGFNGLYRVNSKGQYNVPYGGLPHTTMIDVGNLRRVSEFLSVRDSDGKFLVELFSGDYLNLTRDVIGGPGSLVYFDPPYHPTSKTSNFVDYNEKGFGESDQLQLRDEVMRLTNLGVRVMVSNSDTNFIRDIYAGSEFQCHTISVRRAIAAGAKHRKLTTEVLITNFQDAD